MIRRSHAAPAKDGRRRRAPAARPAASTLGIRAGTLRGEALPLPEHA